MPMGNLGNKISSEDVDSVRDRRNHPKYEPGFEGGEDDVGDFSDIFPDGDFGMDFPSASDEAASAGASGAQLGSLPFGVSSPSSGGATGSIPFGAPQTSGSFAQPLGGFSPMGSNPFAPPGMAQQQPQQEAPKPEPDLLDKLMEISGIAVGSIGNIIAQSFKSIKNRTADDLGYFGTKLMLIAGIMVVGALALGVVGLFGSLEFLRFFGMPFQLILSALLVFGTGSITLGASAYYIMAFSKEDMNNVETIPDVQAQMPQTQEQYENDIQDLLGDLFGGDEEDYFKEEEQEPIQLGFDDPEPEPEPETNQAIDLDHEVDKVQANIPVITREVLFDTFKPFFTTNTPGFADKIVIDKDSDDFYTIEALCMKALASAGRLELSDATDKSKLESVKSTYFTYEMRIKRIKGLTKLEDIEREIVAYFRDSSDDTSVSASADFEGDFYRIVLNKGSSALITLGDLLQLPEVSKYIRDTKNALPIIAGISEDGQPIITDAKFYDTMLIAGKPRSGKSWYVLEIIWTMMVFNRPEDVQFLIIDPKESNMFKTLALMPHVCGLHNDANILTILKDVIEKEGARRKKLLADAKCENVWDLRKKGIDIPILYIVIDEVMTVVSNLNGNSKEFFEHMKVIVSQLPSQGIRLIFVPHRSQGVVDKTVRTNIGFTAAVRADTEVVLETLDIKKWNKPLLNPGDIALKMQGVGKEMLVHGPAVMTTDGDNTEHIISVARAFYKIGISIPDMSSIGFGYNRDLDSIKQELGVGQGSNRVQFDINDVSDVDLNEA